MTPKPCDDDNCTDGWLWKQHISEFPGLCPSDHLGMSPAIGDGHTLDAYSAVRAGDE